MNQGRRQKRNAPDEMNAWSPAANSIQQGTCASSSHEHYQVPVRRNDGTTAVREVVLEGRIGAGRTGSPSPGGEQQKQPIHNAKENRGNTSQQAAEAASRIANPAAGTMGPEGVEEGLATAILQGSQSQGIPPASRRRRGPQQRFASTMQASACEWKRSIGLVCTDDCCCENSIPKQEEERVSRVRGLDGPADSWGVIANRNIQIGEVITVFGGTTYLDGSESVGADFEHLHARLHGAGEPLQYTLQGRLAESNRTKIWAVPEPDKDAVRRRRDVKKSLRQALEKGGDSGIGQFINHTCCNHHCNAEFQLTRAISGDPRQGDTDEEGAIKLVVRASKPIKRHETVLVHYNPNSGIQSWGKVFKCTCCLCRGICGPTTLLSDNTEQSFARLVQQAHHIGIRSNVEISQGDFVSTHQRDFWGNVEEPHTGGAKVRGFCAKNRKLISREVQATELQQEVQKIK